jgi:hypothetical protein
LSPQRVRIAKEVNLKIYYRKTFCIKGRTGIFFG